jgi:hypothetical protein
MPWQELLSNIPDSAASLITCGVRSLHIRFCPGRVGAEGDLVDPEPSQELAEQGPFAADDKQQTAKGGALLVGTDALVFPPLPFSVRVHAKCPVHRGR